MTALDRPRLRLCLHVLALGLGLLAAVPAPAVRAEMFSYALVQDDASLKVQGRVLRLHGIYIPPTGHTCASVLRPVRCASRAALALDLRIQGFVRCRETGRNPDRTLSAICHIEQRFPEQITDLGAWLITEGWALASPEAPFEYFALERIARTRGVGVWGFQADSLR